MSEKIQDKGIVPRTDAFRKAQELKGTIYNFIKDEAAKTVLDAFKKLGYDSLDKPAGEYGDGKGYGNGTENDKVHVKVGGKTNSVLQKVIYFGGKKMVIDIHIDYHVDSETVEVVYNTTEDAAFRGFGQFKDGMKAGGKMQFNVSDMSKFKKEMKEKLSGFAEKEAAYITKTKIGNEDKTEKSTASMVETKNSGNKTYIEFLNKEKGFKRDKKYFNSYGEAIDWGKKNLENFDLDMIKYDSITESVRGKVSTGMKVKISDGSGIASGQIVTVARKQDIKTDGAGVPTNVDGAYKRVDWSKEIPIQYEDGSFGLMFKNRITPITENTTMKNKKLSLLDMINTDFETFGNKIFESEEKNKKEKEDKLLLGSEEECSEEEQNEVTTSASAGAFQTPFAFKKSGILKKKLNETGEWEDDDEGLVWKDQLKGELEYIKDMTSAPMEVISINGFDKYQGPYAIVKIAGKNFKVWTMDEAGKLWIENFPIDNTSGPKSTAGFQGSAHDIVRAIDEFFEGQHTQRIELGNRPPMDLNLNENEAFNNTPYMKGLKQNRRQTNLRIIPEGDGFWTTVPQETLDGYKKNHIMGAPGSENVEVNSKEEEEYNSGGIQKFPGGNQMKEMKKKTIKENEDANRLQQYAITLLNQEKGNQVVVHVDEKNKLLFVFEGADKEIIKKDPYYKLMQAEQALSLLDKGYIGKILNGHMVSNQLTNESVSKRFKYTHTPTQTELNDRWKKLSLHESNSTIKDAECVTPDPEAPKKAARRLSESVDGLNSLSRNNALDNVDMIDGKKVITVNKENCLAPVEYKVFEVDYLNENRTYIWDFNSGNLVKNPNYGLEPKKKVNEGLNVGNIVQTAPQKKPTSTIQTMGEGSDYEAGNYPVYSYTKVGQMTTFGPYRDWEYLTIGSTPNNEDCVQIGPNQQIDGSEMSLLECKAYIEQIKRQYGPDPQEAMFFIMKNFHDFGEYYEACIMYNQENEEAESYAMNVESGAENWDGEAKTFLKANGYHLDKRDHSLNETSGTLDHISFINDQLANNEVDSDEELARHISVETGLKYDSLLKLITRFRSKFLTDPFFKLEEDDFEYLMDDLNF